MNEHLSTSFLLNFGRHMTEQFKKHGSSEEAYRLEDGTMMSDEMKLTAMKAVEAWGLVSNTRIAQESNMSTKNDHIVYGPNGHRFKVGDEVIINKPSHSDHNKLGEVYSVRNYENKPRIGVHALESEGGGGGLFTPEELIPN